MAHYVLVHDAWHGGWCWRGVRTRLRSAGHEVHTPTLTGLGERSHLLTPGIGLRDHVQDVAGLIECEDLHGVILVGHGAAGMLLPAVAETAPDRIAALVYLDAPVPSDGDRLPDLLPEELRDRLSPRGDGWRIPPPRPRELGVTGDDDAAWFAQRLSDHPAGPLAEAVRLRTGAAGRLPAVQMRSRAVPAARAGALPLWRLGPGHVLTDAAERLALALRAPFLSRAWSVRAGPEAARPLPAGPWA